MVLHVNSKTQKVNCLEDRRVESQLKRWTFVSLQYGLVTDSTILSFLALCFILHTCRTGISLTHFSRTVIFRRCSGSIRPYCSPRLRNVQKSASIFRPMIDWERETYERLSKTLRFTFWYSWMYLISNCIFFYFAQKHFVGKSIQGGWLSFEQLRWFTTFIRQAPLNCFLVKVLLQIGKNHKWSTFFITNKGYIV